MINPPIGAFWAAMNIIKTGNVLGIEQEEPEETKMHFGSTKKEENIPDPEVVKAKKRARNLATKHGMAMEIQLLQQQVEFLTERCNRLEGAFMTLDKKFAQFETQRHIELAKLVNGGPTVRK